MSEEKDSQKEKLVENKEDRNNKVPQLDLPVFIIIFIAICIASIAPVTTIGYFYCLFFDPFKIFTSFGNIWLSILSLGGGIFLIYATLLLSTWSISKACLFIVMKGKQIPEGVFEKNFSERNFRQFSLRHLVKGYGILVFKNLAPRWLFRKFISSFIKIGNNVEPVSYTHLTLPTN